LCTFGEVRITKECEMIKYVHTTEEIKPEQLQGFFEGWPNPLTPETHLKLLAESDEIMLAMDDQTEKVVGFITAITDRVLSAYIPLLEVLPEYRKKGIGRELVRRMLARLKDFYMIDLTCEPELRPFYAKLGMRPATGMMIRNYDRQSGAPPPNSFDQKFKKLETQRLVIRRFGNADLPAIFAYRNDPEVARYQRFGSVSKTDLSHLIQGQQSIEPGAPGQWFQFAIALKETGELIGDCALRMDKEDAGRAEVGFTLARAYQGRGFATEAVTRVLDYAFAELGLERIFALTDCENQPSIALLERLDMRLEGHLLKNFLWKGERRDEYRYAILKDEWLQKRKGKKLDGLENLSS